MISRRILVNHIIMILPQISLFLAQIENFFYNATLPHLTRVLYFEVLTEFYIFQ